ncbi:MAG: hypothetical protein ACFB51_03040 [Anaerolineae bacterium]
MKYDVYKLRLKGLAFILAPILMIGAAMGVVFEIGINEGGNESQMDALLIGYAIILFIPIFLGLSDILGKGSPRLALLCAITGILGVAGGLGAAYTRFFEWMLLDSGGTLEGTIYEIDMPTAMFPLAIGALFFPLTPIILGFASLRNDDVSTLSAIFLILGGVFFIMGQAADIALKVTYPLAGIAWLIALAPIGWQYLSQPQPDHGSKSAQARSS